MGNTCKIYQTGLVCVSPFTSENGTIDSQGESNMLIIHFQYCFPSEVTHQLIWLYISVRSI